MNKTLKIVLDAVGLVISATGLSLLFYQEKYVAGCLVLLLFVVLVFVVVLHVRSTPLMWKSIHFYYEFLDTSGKKVHVRKVKKFVVKEKNVTTLVDSGMSATGQLHFLQSNIGKIVDVTDQGGTSAVYTLLPSPLEKSTTVEHIIEYEAIDSFLNPRESVRLNVLQRCLSVGLHVRFLKDRLPKFVNGYGFYRDIASDITIDHLTQNDRDYSLVVDKPKLGSIILLEWEW